MARCGYHALKKVDTMFDLAENKLFLRATCLGFLFSVATASLAHSQVFVCGEDAKAGKQVTSLQANSLFNGKAAGFDLGTSVSVQKNICTSDKAFFFSTPIAEGNYRVSIEFAATAPADITLRTEARRLIFDHVKVEPGKNQVLSFDVNVHVPEIADAPGHVVKLKPREVGNLNWDNKLTIEFNGVHPGFHILRIEPIKEPVVYLAGDSTVTDQDTEPWAAWGQSLPRFFAPGVVIANYAQSGETTKSFVGERRLEKVMSQIKSGDYLFIQFGHNDMKPGAVSLPDYKDLLRDYIRQTKSHGATPVLVTSMNRRTFDETGKIKNSLKDYTDAVLEVAQKEKVLAIDLNAMSKTLFDTLGPEQSMRAFMHYPANTFPNQEKEISDDTHFNGYGSFELARCIVKAIRESQLPLAKFISKDAGDFDPAKPDPINSVTLPRTPLPSKTEDVMKIPQV